MRGKGLNANRAGTHPPLLHKRSQVLQRKFRKDNNDSQQKLLPLTAFAVQVFEEALENWEPADSSFEGTLPARVSRICKASNHPKRDDTFSYIEGLLDATARFYEQTSFRLLSVEGRREVAESTLTSLQESKELYEKGELPPDFIGR